MTNERCRDDVTALLTPHAVCISPDQHVRTAGSAVADDFSKGLDAVLLAVIGHVFDVVKVGLRGLCGVAFSVSALDRFFVIAGHCQSFRSMCWVGIWGPPRSLCSPTKWRTYPGSVRTLGVSVFALLLGAAIGVAHCPVQGASGQLGTGGARLDVWGDNAEPGCVTSSLLMCAR